MTTNAKFWDGTAAKYAASPIKDQETYEHTLAETRKFLRAEDHALEIGCGTGSTALLLSDSVGTLTASDLSGNMIEIAKDKAAAQNVTNVDFVQATPTDPNLASRSYDAVLGFNILHLLDNLPEDLKVLRDRLKPGGLFISKTPCLGDWNLLPLIRLAIPVMQFFGKAPYVNYLKSTDLEAQIAAAGFEIVTADNHSSFSRFIVAKQI
jgi:ubiquinone/menaquinone biosynthesis C-methylase UbiE